MKISNFKDGELAVVANDAFLQKEISEQYKILSKFYDDFKSEFRKYYYLNYDIRRLAVGIEKNRYYTYDIDEEYFRILRLERSYKRKDIDSGNVNLNQYEKKYVYKDIEPESTKSVKSQPKVQKSAPSNNPADYNSKGEYKPVESMTQEEIKAELEEMLKNSLDQ